MSTRARIGKVLRRWADRIDHHGAPRSMGRSFTFEPGRGMVFHEDSKTGCPLYYLGMDDYDRAHRDAGFDNGGKVEFVITHPALYCVSVWANDMPLFLLDLDASGRNHFHLTVGDSLTTSSFPRARVTGLG